MKAFLLYRDRDFDLRQKLPWNEQALMQDLELERLLSAMALGDDFLLEVAKKALLAGSTDDLDTIRYRQDILKDCLRNPSVVRAIYAIAGRLTPNCLVLLNESFAATNEREASEIARQIVCAVAEERVKVFFVTHLYDFAHELHGRRMGNALFLRAERRPDGRRTFKLIEGEPLQTSYGEDLYHSVFGVG